MVEESPQFIDYVISFGVTVILLSVLTINIPHTIYNFIIGNSEGVVLAKY
jgi:hypothetical protein